jgi:hypothetical protein
MANAVPVFVSTFVSAGIGVAQSGFATFSFANSAGFDVYVPVFINSPGTTSISAGAEVTVYRSMDGGTNWETEGWPARVFSKPTTASQLQKAGVRLSQGVFLVSVMVGGGCASTWTAQFQTAWIISAFA